MERSERPVTGKSVERPVSNWRSREQQKDDFVKMEKTNDRPVTSAGRPQTRIERPVSRRGLQSAARETSSEQSNVVSRTITTARNTIARPPSASGYSQQRVTTGTSRLGTTSTTGGSTRVKTGLPSSVQMNMNVLDRPITQQGIAGVRPGTTRGLPMNRQIQDKRYYEGLVQLKIRELSQEIGTMSREIDTQNKERATFLHYDNRAKELAAELTDLQGQLADYNIVIDKTASNVERDSIELEIREMSMNNDRASTEIENIIEQRRFKEQQLRDVTENIDSEQKKATRIIETMDPVNREKYNALEVEKANLETEIGKMQREIDLLSGERRNLEEQISLSQIKQEAVKLRVKLVEVESKRDRFEKEQKNKLTPDEERERLLSKVKQDNMDIVAAERRITDAEKQINDIEHELEQLESDLEDGNSEKQVKYKELRKREEAMEQFMPSFDQNKKEEIEKLENLESNVVERLEELSYAIDNDARITPSEEIALLRINSSQEKSVLTSVDQSFEGLTREHTRLQQTLGKMEILETRLKSELEELNEKINKRQSELVVLEDLDGLKTRSELLYEKLIAEKDDLNKRQPICRRDVEIARNEHDEIKKRLDKNETYLQISALEEKLEKLRVNNGNIEEFIVEGRNRVNYKPLKERAFTLVAQYNVVLRETVKSAY